MSDYLQRLAVALGSAPVEAVGRVGITSGDDTVPMLRTVVLTRGGEYLLLRYEQSGFTWAAAPALAMMWPPDDLDDDETLTVVALDGAPPAAAFPRTLTRLSALIGTGPYQDVLALTLHLTGGADIVLTTTDDALNVATPAVARTAAETAAAAQHMSIETVTLHPY